MRNERTTSIPELQTQLLALLEQRDDGDNFVMHRIIETEEKLLRQMRQEPERYAIQHRQLQTRLVDHLINYGSYLKTEYRKDDVSAKRSLQKALRYERMLPLAHYRLGFLAYKEKDYSAAIQQFEQALLYQSQYPDHRHQLSDQQMYHAQLYKTNSALFIAAASYEEIVAYKQSGEVEERAIDQSPLPHLYKLITDTTELLTLQEVQVLDASGERTCSREEYDHLLENTRDSHLLLDLTDREAFVRFGKKSVAISRQEWELLRDLMTRSSQSRGLLLDDAIESFNGRPRSNAYAQKIRRLRRKLSVLPLTADVIGTLPRDQVREREGSYYYKSDVLPYLVVQLADYM
ncbi:hypothetical protein [Sporosarcina sp. Te-1]|uniref:hypothetical protein n=1 Tax=Sporosarcina sp. Te-1 TaxID=2818390 RepID=UPI001A9F6199|nr:hypothetical protein [Sporosarcina sp. Te-1]QTD39470.1 hypothetical protein J3U78_11360 [Sporosarcina sp. Te-1]